jgi:hypothetical protein
MERLVGIVLTIVDNKIGKEGDILVSSGHYIHRDDLELVEVETMSWNYRLVETEVIFDGEARSFVGIYEVYYDKNGNPEGHTEDPVTLSGETAADIQEDLVYIQEAFKKPLIRYINGEYQCTS